MRRSRRLTRDDGEQRPAVAASGVLLRGVPGLAALLHPHSIAELREQMRKSELFVVHGVGELGSIPLLESLETLLATWPDAVDAIDPEVADEAVKIAVSPDEARQRFATGTSLLFNEVQDHVPELVTWLDAIRADLELSALTQRRCLIYATPAGGGTAPHFDQNVNFVLQIHGTKRWFLAPNMHVDRPLTRHTMGLPTDPELASYADLPMPETLADATEVVLAPGSLLFVPRGTWHATSATTDAVSLNFTFTAPTWLDLFGAALRSKLALSSGWRETASPPSVAVFETLLRELADDAASWSAADILAVTEG